MNKRRLAPLSIHLLGGFRVLVRDVPVQDAAWTRPQARLLVKLLALEPQHRLHRQQIMDMLWPGDDEASGAAKLHKIIHLARRALEPDLKSGADSEFILTRDQQVQLPSDAFWIDAEEFERKAAQAIQSGSLADYEDALSFYRGDLLTEDLYSDWCARKRDQLSSLYRDLLLKAGLAYETNGDYTRAIGQFDKLTAVEAANEQAHRELMRLYTLSGRRSEALRQFRRCCEAVRSELDVEPEEATRDLHRRIVAGQLQPPESRIAGDRETTIETIAVLPFENDTRDPGVAYLAEGMSESLIKSLSHLPELRVLAYSTVARYRRNAPDPKTLRRRLGVPAVVSGRITAFEGALIIAVELVNATDGSRIWGDQYRLDVADLLAIQVRIARAISEKLRARLTPQDGKAFGKRYTNYAEAYRLYLKGRFLWNKRTGESLRKGVEFFEKAIEKDRDYALAYAGLADCYNLLSLYGAISPKKTMPKARAAARKALRIDDSLAEAHTSLGYTYLYYDWDWASAEREFQCALEINPNYATAHHWYHEYLTAMGRFEEQIAEILHAQELDPLSLIINTDVGWGLYYARAYDQAAEQLRHTLDLDSNFVVAHLILGLASAQQNRMKEAISSLEKAVVLSGDNPFLMAIGSLGYVYAISGQVNDAQRLLSDLNDRNGSDYYQAMVLAGLGDRKGSIDRLNRAMTDRQDRLIYLNVDPVFDTLRSDSGFKRVLSGIGLPNPSLTEGRISRT